MITVFSFFAASVPSYSYFLSFILAHSFPRFSHATSGSSQRDRLVA